MEQQQTIVKGPILKAKNTFHFSPFQQKRLDRNLVPDESNNRALEKEHLTHPSQTIRPFDGMKPLVIKTGLVKSTGLTVID